MKNFWLQQYQSILERLEKENNKLAKAIEQQIARQFSSRNLKQQEQWQQAISALANIRQQQLDLDRSAPKVIFDGDYDKQGFDASVQLFQPWRKGPFQLNDLYIDTEWRSDWKWERIKPHIAPLKGKTVLDVGCGSGYHCLRMKAAGASSVIGIEPMLLYVAQFLFLNRLYQQDSVSVLPFTLEQWLEFPICFDQVFSMGVLYHRRSPIDHLLQLKQCLSTGGQLVLETLIIAGESQEILVPEGRYAKMRNVWFIPAIAHLKNWLKRAGFKEINVININQTRLQEQRTTQWMPFESLKDFLDPNDMNKTIEGYPAPLRATLTAIKK